MSTTQIKHQHNYGHISSAAWINQLRKSALNASCSVMRWINQGLLCQRASGGTMRVVLNNEGEWWLVSFKLFLPDLGKQNLEYSRKRILNIAKICHLYPELNSPYNHGAHWSRFPKWRSSDSVKTGNTSKRDVTACLPPWYSELSRMIVPKPKIYSHLKKPMARVQRK